ncbi:hypothetical protein D3C75_677670 [compost metagenome]
MVPVHQNAAFLRALYFRKSKPGHRSGPVNGHLAVVDAIILQISPDKTAHLIIGYLADKAGAQPQPRRADHDIGG